MKYCEGCYLVNLDKAEKCVGCGGTIFSEINMAPGWLEKFAKEAGYASFPTFENCIGVACSDFPTFENCIFVACSEEGKKQIEAQETQSDKP